MKISGNLNSTLLGILFVSTLGCSSSSDPEPPPPPPPPTNQAPTVTAPDQTGLEKSDITVTADATDSDGTISSYSWTQTSGPAVTLDDASASSVTFTAPEVITAEEIQLNITVTDDDGATATANVLITVEPILVNLSISGTVYDWPMENSPVVVTVGSSEFTAISDEQGSYSVNLAVDDSLVDGFTSITATGTDANSGVKLLSLLGEYQELVARAGQDEDLSVVEHRGVNLTAVTTANAVLVEQAIGKTVESQDEFDRAWVELDGLRTHDYAAIVKLVAEHSQNNSGLDLPNGLNDTLALLRDEQQSQFYLDNAFLNFNTEYNDVSNDIYTNPNGYYASLDISILPIVNNYYFHTVAQNYDGRGRLELLDDNSGSLLLEQSEYDLLWGSSEQGVTLNYRGGDVVEKSETRWDETLGQMVTVDTMSSGRTLFWLYQGRLASQFIVVNSLYERYPMGEYADVDIADDYQLYTAINSAMEIDAADVLQLNREYSLPVPDANQDILNPKGEVAVDNNAHAIGAMKFVFSGDLETGGNVSVSKTVLNGDGSETEDVSTMQWNIDSDGYLQITGSDKYEFVFLEADDIKTPKVNVVREDSDGKRSITREGLLKEASWEATSLAGIYNWGNVFNDPNYYFWLELNADGTSLTVSGSDSDDSGSVETDEFFQMPGFWQINTDGELVVRRYRYNQGNSMPNDYCMAVVWDPADDADCVLYHERKWDLYQISNDKYHLFHKHRFYFDAWRAYLTIPDEGGHIVYSATTDTRHWIKVNERPHELSTTQQRVASDVLGAKDRLLED